MKTPILRVEYNIFLNGICALFLGNMRFNHGVSRHHDKKSWCVPLAPWRPMESGSCTSPLLSLPSILAELRTSLSCYHSLLASLTETPHLLFRTSTLLDRSRPLHSAVLTDQARDLAGAVTFTRSTPGCGTLAGPGPSLESAGFWSQKPKGYADSPGLKRPGALRKPIRPGRVQLTRYDKHIPGIYQSYVPTQ
jgi:hypothetical protein